jgi:large subunit ribosomal protein L25
MKHAELEVQARELFGNQARKLRRDGILPAVVYSKKQEPIHIQVNTRDFYTLFKQSGYTHVVELKLGSQKNTPVIVHEVDVHPVTGEARHVDFLAVNLKEKVKTSVPVELVGTAVGVKELGALLSSNLDEIEVEALPDNIPESIQVDVTHLAQIHDSIKVSDLAKSDKYDILEEPEEVIVSLVEGATGIEEETTAPEMELPEGAKPEEENSDESKKE